MDICRLCGLNNVPLIDIFNGNQDILGTLKTCLSEISLEKDDNLPKHVCLICLEKLKEYESFHKKCKAVEVSLKPSSSLNCTEHLGCTSLYDLLDEFLNHENDMDFDKSQKEKQKNYLEIKDRDDCPKVKSVIQSNSKNVMETRRFLNSLRFKCKMCKKTCLSKGSLLTHIDKFHYRIIQFSCKICGSGFLKKSQARKHFSQNHSFRRILDKKLIGENLICYKKFEQQIFSCSGCKQCFINADFLKFHMVNCYSIPIETQRIHRYELKMKCNQTKPTFGFNTKKNGKFSKHPHKFKYVCYSCGTKYLHSSTFYYHQLGHLLSKPYECEECFLAFNHCHQLNLHLKNIHFSEKNQICPINYNEFKFSKRIVSKYYFGITRYTKNYNGLFQSRNVSKKIPQQKYKCDICLKIFKFKKSYRTHRQNYSKSLYKCNTCNMKFKKLFNLKTHKISHIKKEKRIANHLCPICGKAYALSNSLFYHKQTHFNYTKSFQCNDCPKVFRTKRCLRSHLRMHTGEKRKRKFKCQFCDKLWVTKSEKEIHENIHLNYRPSECQICKKGFVSNCLLKDHMFSHSDEQNFKCNENGCGKSYKHKATLRKHFLEAHYPENQKKYYCNLCKTKFATNNLKKKHMKSHKKLKIRDVIVTW